MKGVLGRTRPITKNIRGVTVDGGKLRKCPGQGIVAFCLFPVACGDNRWMQYLDRIATELGVGLSEGQHSSRVTIPIGDGCQADIVVATFFVSKDVGPVFIPLEPLEPGA